MTHCTPAQARTIADALESGVPQNGAEDALRSLADQLEQAAPQRPTFQARVLPWMLACFGAKIAGDREERNHRFLEEALELVQSTGCTSSEAHQLVDYVFRRTVGEPAQEVGGVMVTLAALCLANGLDMHDAAEAELARIWTKVEAIRAKQAAKPKHSPLPAAAPVVPAPGASEWPDTPMTQDQFNAWFDALPWYIRSLCTPNHLIQAAPVARLSEPQHPENCGTGTAPASNARLPPPPLLQRTES